MRAAASAAEHALRRAGGDLEPPGLVPADPRVRAQRAGGVFGNRENRSGGTRESRPRPRRHGRREIESGRQAAAAANAAAGAPQGEERPLTRGGSDSNDKTAAFACHTGRDAWTGTQRQQPIREFLLLICCINSKPWRRTRPLVVVILRSRQAARQRRATGE